MPRTAPGRPERHRRAPMGKVPGTARHPRPAARGSAGLAARRDLAADLGRRYGYPQIETPLVEESGVFERGHRRGHRRGREGALPRPERRGDDKRTAGAPAGSDGRIVRAYLQHGM